MDLRTLPSEAASSALDLQDHLEGPQRVSKGQHFIRITLSRAVGMDFSAANVRIPYSGIFIGIMTVLQAVELRRRDLLKKRAGAKNSGRDTT
jgi:hypothetical protein